MTNIAELLKDVPEGIKLYSPICGPCELSGILYDNGIRVIAHDIPFRFDKYGRFCSSDDAECLLFPNKECRTWEGWKLPVEHEFKVGDWVAGIDDEGDMATEKIVSFSHNKVLLVDTDGCHTEYPKTELNGFRLWTIADAKDGDVLVTKTIRSCPFIYRKTDYNNDLAYYYAGIDGNGNFSEGCLKRTLFHFGFVSDVIPATKEQRDLLFAKMKEAGYEWDADKKELRKIKPHYDIANFRPFDKVLVRDHNNNVWRCDLFSHYDNKVAYPFVCTGTYYMQCIPYNEETKHLLGTTDMPDEMYINW